MIITDFKDSYMRVQKEEFLLIMTHKCHWEIALYDVTNGHAVNRSVTFFFLSPLDILGKTVGACGTQDTGWDAVKGTKMIWWHWLS